MSERSEAAEPGTSLTRAGVIYAVLAAASAALLLFLPVLLLGITMSVVASVMRGEVVAWRGSVDLGYAFVGIPALLGVFLLILPSRLFRAAGRRLGSRRAIRLVGGLLVAWNAGVAVIWAWQATSGPTPALQGDAIWYAVGFGITAIVILIATVVAEKRAVGAAVALSGGLAVGLVALVVALVSVWGSPPRIPPGAQTVHIVVTASEVRLEPASVHSGPVYFVVDRPDDPGEHAGFAFVSAGYGSQCPPCNAPLPLSDDAVARLAQGDYQGTGTEEGWGRYAKFPLLEGKYASLTGPGGAEPGVPPH
ncbi:MAG: hypothetical protein M3R49_03725 [Chloroflexota bacterium]|nr:hypothetical protein [Chloroflexota bacterium]